MSHSFEVQSSTVMHEAPIIALRRDQVTMPGGRVAAREIIEHFGAVAVVARRADGRIALVRQYRHSVQQRLWELPAGLLDMKDEDPLLCAQRELYEEAGLKADRWGLLLDVVSSPGFCDEAVRVYLAEGLVHVDKPEAEDEEADMVLEWVELVDAVDMVLSGRIVNSIAVSGIMTAAWLARTDAEPRSCDCPFELRPHSLATRRARLTASKDLKTL